MVREGKIILDFKGGESVKISEIKELIQLVNQTEISELEIEQDDIRLVLRKGGNQVFRSETPSFSPPPQTKADLEVSLPAQKTTHVSQEAAKITPQEKAVKSPMVGTFYRAASPEAAPFVNIGDRIQVGQNLCIIEAMKLMNEIEAEVAGKIVDILVEDGQPVEYGQTLFRVDPEK